MIIQIVHTTAHDKSGAPYLTGGREIRRSVRHVGHSVPFAGHIYAKVWDWAGEPWIAKQVAGGYQSTSMTALPA
jgi:hypothetical protein